VRRYLLQVIIYFLHVHRLQINNRFKRISFACDCYLLYTKNREDYIKYNKIVGRITKLCSKLKLLDPTNPTRIRLAEQLMQKLYNMGIVNTTDNLTAIEKLTVSSFCRYFFFLFFYLLSSLGLI